MIQNAYPPSTIACNSDRGYSGRLVRTVCVSITLAPPALPVYTQPMAPADGYLWTPGYWAYGDEGYFWVPGTWVMAPEVGFLWTPGYWGWGDNAYVWHGGYWGEHVGFYGGVNYGFGYGGVGYQGGYWNHGAFNYNRSVNNVNVTNIHNVYNKSVTNNTSFNHVSYNGGRGGVSARPTQAEEAVSRERHSQPTASQTQHVQAARSNHALLASVNHGRPAIAATAKPAEFGGHGVVAAKQAGAPYKAAENHAAARPEQTKQLPMPRTAPLGRKRRAIPQRCTPLRLGRPQRSSNHSAPRSQPAAHAQPAPRAQAAPRPEARVQSAPRSQPAVHAQPAPRAQAAPRPEARVQSAPRPAEKEGNTRER